MKPRKGIFYTELCRLLDIRYPIIQGAMANIGGPALVAAVSNAGGLGVLPTWSLSLEQLRRLIERTRELTSCPFGVNITPLSPKFTRTRAELVVEKGVGVVTTGRADPRHPTVAFLRSHGVKVIGVVPSVKLALRLEEEGVEALVASGCEGGGHVGSVCSMALIPQVVDAVKIPVIAAGGIGDHRGFVAALAFGACGIQMGSRFIATEESEASPREKQRLLEAGDEDTLVTTVFTGKPVRTLKSPQLESILSAIAKGGNREELKAQILDLRRKKRGKHPEFTSVACGQGAGLVEGIAPAAAIITEIIEEAEILCRALRA